jgi:uncharacterized protein YjbI with pentapeptide repeats
LILLYLHTLLGQWHLDEFKNFRNQKYSIYIFNMASNVARRISICTFYLLGPGLLAWFVFKLRAWPGIWLWSFGAGGVVVTLLLARRLAQRHRLPAMMRRGLTLAVTAIFVFISWPHLSEYLFPLQLANSDLSELSLSGYYLRKASFSAANLRGADFSKIPEDHLERADFSFSNLERADFTCAHLEKADFNHAHLESADFSKAHLDGAKFVRAHLSKADLSRQNLTGFDFTRADLEGADLSESDLENANFSFTNLNHANLSGSRLDGAKFVRANLDGANVEGATFTGARFERSKLHDLENSGEHQFMDACGDKYTMSQQLMPACALTPPALPLSVRAERVRAELAGICSQ